MYCFSATTLSFYPKELLEIYADAGTLPADLVEIDDDVYLEFINPPAGKVRVAGKDGLPAWEDIPLPTKEQLIEQTEAKKQSLIAEVNTETEMLRAKLALGRIKDDEKALLNAWLDYLDELEAVDVSTAPDIEWPVAPE
ncbi:tail fiber assembly protein [Yersinia enterocolitica]|uniref:tail fiber assembly protein n=1 Tax=Yersinia enterocolitica TaxID=630 RepID=UPI003D05D6E5